ncbi:MAG TPA: acetyl-CoA C-acyltransferase, partial [Polyangiaceae bacterium]
MAKQVEDAYIVAATRTPIGKAPRGTFKTVRPDDLLVHALRSLLARVPKLDANLVEDVIVGCAMPEAEQGANVARTSVLLAGLPNTIGGVTVNRFCASGTTALAMAADRIRVGEADVMIAAGTESMSMIPMGGNTPSLNPNVFTRDENVGIAFGMGITAEKVAQRWNVSREDQDAFALSSHRKAIAGRESGAFDDEITPFEFEEHVPDLANGSVVVRKRGLKFDEGPRADTSLDALAKLKPAFAAKGSVTAGNSSQMSDGAGALLLVSERTLKRLDLTPLARFVSFAVKGVPPEIMGIGPKEAIPAALAKAELKLDD